jgi:hypothetical protein
VIGFIPIQTKGWAQPRQPRHREYQVLEMEPGPTGMLQPPGQALSHTTVARLAQRLDERVGPNNPEHVETAQGVE